MNTKIVKLFGWFGIVTPIIGFSMIFLAISTAPWFNWYNNALSDLGVEGITAAIFNGGLIMTASVLALFSLSVYEFGKENRFGKIGFVLLLFSAVFLLGIGIYPETAGSIHMQYSVSFFVTLPLAIIVNSYYTIRQGNKQLGILGLIAGAIAILIWIFPWEGVAIPETVSAGSAGIWSILMGLWLTRYDENEKIDDLID